MPSRLRTIFDKNANPRVIIVDRSSAVAPDMGDGPRPIIEDALRKVGVEMRLNAGVTSLDKSGVRLSTGEHIEAATVIWAAGIRANPLTTKVAAERDNFDRLLVDGCLRVPSAPGVFATGDAARAACDDVGNYALMSCQHATRMGAFAGNNAAAELLGVPTRPYHQKAYVTCLTSVKPARCSPAAGSARWRWLARRRRRPSRRSIRSGSTRQRPSVPQLSPLRIRNA